jgi:hypothetical protein
LRTFILSCRAIVSCAAIAKTDTIMQNSKNRPQRKCRERKRRTYVIVSHSYSWFLLVSSALSMSHLGRWSWPCLLTRVSLGFLKPHVRRWNAGLRSNALPPPTGENMLVMPATSVRCKSGLQGVPGTSPTYLTNGSRYLKCRRFYHHSGSMILERWGRRTGCETAAEFGAL